MTIGQRLHYTDILRREREQRMLILAAASSVIPRADRGVRRVLVDMEAETLASIAHALTEARTEPEEFGLCEKCGADIEPERLEAAPWSRYCARHAARTVSC